VHVVFVERLNEDHAKALAAKETEFASRLKVKDEEIAQLQTCRSGSGATEKVT
jgi:hypothetical protein